MTAEQIAGLIVALFLMSLGVAGSVLPGMPSTPAVLLIAALHKLYFAEAGPGWIVLGLMAGMTILSLVVDYLASIYGARRMGATWRGVWGAVVGGVVGLFFSLPGIILGPFVGATLLEMAGGRNWKEAAQAGLGALIGLIAGALGKAAICLLMMLFFAVNVIYRSVQFSS